MRIRSPHPSRSEASNILVTEVDGRPAPKIIDFGVARQRSSNGRTSDTLRLITRQGAGMGTPDYMSRSRPIPQATTIDTGRMSTLSG